MTRFFGLKSDKIENLKLLRNRLSDQINSLVGISLASSLSRRNLGVTFNQDQFHLRNIAMIKNILIQNVKLAHAFVTSGLDFCDSLLSGCRYIIPLN